MSERAPPLDAGFALSFVGFASIVKMSERAPPLDAVGRRGYATEQEMRSLRGK